MHLIPLLAEYVAETLVDLTIFKGADFDKSGKDSLSSFFQHCVYMRNLHLSYFDFGLTMV
jgi:hypothetical protein